jgi:hypothetical protein
LAHPVDVVIAGLDPAIHSVTAATCGNCHGMDARTCLREAGASLRRRQVKSGHDDNWMGATEWMPWSSHGMTTVDMFSPSSLEARA